MEFTSGYAVIVSSLSSCVWSSLSTLQGVKIQLKQLTSPLAKDMFYSIMLSCLYFYSAMWVGSWSLRGFVQLWWHSNSFSGSKNKIKSLQERSFTGKITALYSLRIFSRGWISLSQEIGRKMMAIICSGRLFWRREHCRHMPLCVWKRYLFTNALAENVWVYQERIYSITPGL